MKSLKEFRVESGMSKRRFAIFLGIPYTTYLRYEADLGKASFNSVREICIKLNIPITDIDTSTCSGH